MNKKLQSLLLMGAKQAGTYDTDEVLCRIEEQLTGKEHELAERFLNWVNENNKKFGWNIGEVYKEFKGESHVS